MVDWIEPIQTPIERAMPDLSKECINKKIHSFKIFWSKRGDTLKNSWKQALICLFQFVSVFSRIDNIDYYRSGSCWDICARILNAGTGRTTDSTWNVCVAAIWFNKRSFSKSDTNKLQDNNGR